MIYIIVGAFICALILFYLNNKDQNIIKAVQDFSRKSSSFQVFVDKYTTLEQLQQGLREAGLESSNLIVAVDFTRSNTWNGKNSFGAQCLHSISPYTLNPYQAALSLICKTLEPFDDDHLIPAFGFGDVTTRDKAVFPFFPDGRPCQGLNEVLTRYSEITPRVELSGPTSFAPIIREAIKIVSKASAYHILIIIADGQVDKVQETIDAIVECSKYPISIILIGVGDGPWDRMMEFDDELPQRQFDNFQFVNFNELNTKWKGNEVNFAMHALMEIPDQYKAIKQLKLL